VNDVLNILTSYNRAWSPGAQAAATLADVIGYRFLVDRDVSKVAAHLPQKRTLTLSAVGLSEEASDSLIVQEAYERRCIIVTANGEHFKAAMLRFMRVQKRKQCYDLNGLIVLPSGYEHQKRLLQDAQDRLRFGGRRLAWRDVWERDFYVRLKKSGLHEVWRFPPCRYCTEQTVRARR